MAVMFFLSDMCGFCKTVQDSGEQNLDDNMRRKYAEHLDEKESVRGKKNMAKDRAMSSEEHGAAIFDLQQVLYTPSGNHNEIFYRRRLANYNFTIYNLRNKEGYCQVWHEGVAKRGSCEIATGLLRYLENEDMAGVKFVELFSDGCAGQNKNSVLPCMFRHFLKTSEHLQEITLHFFEANHGQSECDSMHSTIERNFKVAGDVLTPAQLSTVIRTAKKKLPRYIVHELETGEVKDWKSLSINQQFLKVRLSDKSTAINWTKFKAIMVRKFEPEKIYFKVS